MNVKITAHNGIARRQKRPTRKTHPAVAEPGILENLYHSYFKAPVVEKIKGEISLINIMDNAYNALADVIPDTKRELLDKYDTAWANHENATARAAFESGFRLAVQIILAGMQPDICKPGQGL